MQEIMRNQVLNTHKFGKLFVSSNGDVRAGSVLEAPIGNLHAENIRRLALLGLHISMALPFSV